MSGSSPAYSLTSFVVRKPLIFVISEDLRSFERLREAGGSTLNYAERSLFGGREREGTTLPREAFFESEGFVR